MDILNFISWIRGGRQVTTVDPTKTLLPVGLKDPKRDDGYLAGAISVADFAAQVAAPKYKVYTALLSQSGTADPTVIVLENTMVNPVTVARASAGNYTVTCNDFNFFTVNKTAISAISPNANGPIIRTAVNNPTTFRINTVNNSITQPYSVLSDDILNLSMVEVRVYN